MLTREASGINKAIFHANAAKSINPHIDVEVFQNGVGPGNVVAVSTWADLVIDCVDVTSEEAIRNKMILHITASRLGKPVISMLDLGFCQWGKIFNYKNKKVRPFDGNLQSTERMIHPLKILFTLFPLSCVPSHCLPMLISMLKNESPHASQLACAVDLLSATIAATVIRYASTQELPSGWNYDLSSLAFTPQERLKHYLQYPKLYLEAQRLLDELI